MYVTLAIKLTILNKFREVKSDAYQVVCFVIRSGIRAASTLYSLCSNYVSSYASHL